MSIKALFAVSFVFFLTSLPSWAPGTEWFVDCSVAEPGDGKTPETAFETIQEGIDSAFDGDTVIVAESTYVENIHFHGKNIVLRSTDPLDPAIVASTIIDGNRVGSVVSFDGTEDGTCVLGGFTIRNGEARDGGGICGGTSDHRTHATIRNNTITENWASTAGGGLAFCDGVIANNLVTANSAESEGGGLAYCAGPIQNNVISGNSAADPYHNDEGYGGGLCDCGGSIRKNTIWANWARQCGGGLCGCDGAIENNVIGGNSAGAGGGLCGCGGTIRSDTIVENSAVWTRVMWRGGGGFCACRGTITNCIIWGNTARYEDPKLNSSSDPTYSCIEDWQAGGEGNMSSCPHFVNPRAGDYHLDSWSPCIDAGDPSSDFSNEPQPNGGRINMGAYGNTPEAASASEDTDGDLLADDWETHFFDNLELGASDDPDGDGVSNEEEYRQGTNPTNTWYVDGAVAASGSGTAPETAFKTIQEAVDAVPAGHTLSVLPGDYSERLLIRKSLSLVGSGSGDDGTTIDAGGGACAVTFIGLRYETLSPESVLSERERTRFSIEGFTVTNSATDAVGAIYCSYGSIRIKDCRIRGNSATFGACVFLDESLAVIEGCEMTGNRAEESGGAIYAWASELSLGNCIIKGNTAERIEPKERIPGEGGGVSCWWSPVQAVRTVIAGNAARAGGAIFCEESPAIILVNSTVADNLVTDEAGAIHCQEGAAWQSDLLVTNSVIWGNGLAFSGRWRPEVTFSDVEDPSFSGRDGNLCEPPNFVPVAGDYHLATGSPCVDAGDPDPVYNDQDGSRCDMGAFGGTGRIGDIGIPPERAYLTIETDLQGHKCVVIHWFANPSGTFFIEWQGNMQGGWPHAEAFQPDEGWLHRWVDTNATKSYKRFYRIGTVQ